MRIYVKNISANRDELIEKFSKTSAKLFSEKGDTFTFTEKANLFNELKEIEEYFKNKTQVILVTKEK